MINFSWTRLLSTMWNGVDAASVNFYLWLSHFLSSLYSASQSSRCFLKNILDRYLKKERKNINLCSREPTGGNIQKTKVANKWRCLNPSLWSILSFYNELSLSTFMRLNMQTLSTKCLVRTTWTGHNMRSQTAVLIIFYQWFVGSGRRLYYIYS